MLFNSYEFLLVFLPIAIVAYGIADRYDAARMPVLILLSLIFYGYWDVRFIPVMIGSILINWFAVKLFSATQNGAIIAAAIVANLGVLGTFKYANFFADNLAYLLGTPVPHLELALPRASASSPFITSCTSSISGAAARRSIRSTVTRSISASFPRRSPARSHVGTRSSISSANAHSRRDGSSVAPWG